MKKVRKALIAAGGAFVLAVGQSLSDGDLTVHELMVSVGAALVLGAGVYGVRNGDKPA